MDKKYKSECCNSKVKVEGLPDFEGDKYPCTVYHICTKCNKPCNIRTNEKFNKEIKKSVKSGKPESVYKGVKMDSVDKLFAKINAKRKAHPIYYFFNDVYYRVKNFITGIPLNVKVFIQRGKRGWSIRDVWGFDYYLAKVISEGLKHLKENKMGFPCSKEQNSEQAKKNWNNILDKIIKTFETAMKIADGDYHYIPSKKFKKKDYNTMKKISTDINKKYPNDLPKQKTMTKRESLEYEKGFDLFKEWFFALWD